MMSARAIGQPKVANRRDYRPEPGEWLRRPVGTAHVARLWTVTLPVGPKTDTAAASDVLALRKTAAVSSKGTPR